MKTTRTPSIPRHGRAILGLGLSLALLSACGSDPGDTTTSATETGATETGTTETGTTAPGTTDSSTSPTTGTATTDDTATTSPTTGTATTDDTTDTTGNEGQPSLSFFVSSTGSLTGNLGGLDGADKRCKELADAVGEGDKNWRAYLSTEKGPDDQPVHARDRIGKGPWYNADLVMIAADLDDLHTKEGDHTLFLNENGEPINGQWEGSPTPNEHDILTGSNKDGTVAVGFTCADWTSEDASVFAQVGHSDGLGPMGSDAEQYRSWNSVHENGGCHDTAPKGGAGLVYCFAAD
ncbi:hypothetical protein [Nannocystis bainbridge]|uniref:Collagenase NC10 and Endostatin n=1 Tax=Nannocystis bainbridge TaxID=2995303 RepID=A0ABT5E9Q1_9BACT|nr:hypothetical protein [Nannocystis bainbridge]MDC0721653.1 hypothetical protein [Nannocystis bainbridge]